MAPQNVITIMAAILCFSTIQSATVVEKDFSNLFKGYTGTVVVYDQTGDKFTVHNQKRSKTRFTPLSTFKIPNSIIALECRVIENIDQQYLWDSTKYPFEDWWPPQWHQKHNLRTAIKYSVVPFYRSIASRIGEEKMNVYITRFQYGNMDISSGVDNFWLDGSMSISAMEQVEFLRKFYNHKLAISDSTVNQVKTILVQEQTANYRLSAKTGGGPLNDDPQKALGWYVGYIEKGKDIYFFALNIDGKSVADIKDSRIEIARSVLKELKIIE